MPTPAQQPNFRGFLGSSTFVPKALYLEIALCLKIALYLKITLCLKIALYLEIGDEVFVNEVECDAR